MLSFNQSFAIILTNYPPSFFIVYYGDCMKVFYLHGKIAKGIIIIVAVLLIVSMIFMSFKVLDNKAKSVYKGVVSEVTVIIDAGHGGVDGGAVAPDGTVEKDINLSVALKLQKIMTLFGYNTVMVRNTDTLISDKDASTIRQKKSTDLHNRAKLLQSYDNAVLISIHQNKYTSSKYSGTQVFYSPNNESSKLLAQCIQDSVVNGLQPQNDRQIKPSGSEIYLLYTAQKPAVMVECGFLSNIEELMKLKDDKYQSSMATAVFLGINQYFYKGM